MENFSWILRVSNNVYCKDFRAVILGTYFERVLINRLNNFHKGHFGGECVSMVDDWFSFIAVPAVQLHTAAAMIQSSGGGVTVQTRRVEQCTVLCDE